MSIDFSHGNADETIGQGILRMRHDGTNLIWAITHGGDGVSTYEASVRFDEDLDGQPGAGDDWLLLDSDGFIDGYCSSSGCEA